MPSVHRDHELTNTHPVVPGREHQTQVAWAQASALVRLPPWYREIVVLLEDLSTMRVP